jgi:hypothetical protein
MHTSITCFGEEVLVVLGLYLKDSACNQIVVALSLPSISLTTGVLLLVKLR